MKNALVGIIAFISLILVIASIGVVSAYTFDPYHAPDPNTGGGITIDGSIADWDTTGPDSADAFAPMFRGNDPVSSKYEADLFLRFDPSTSTLYALVYTLEDFPALDTMLDDAFIKIDGKIRADGNSPSTNFVWVYEDGVCRGFEAAFSVADLYGTDNQCIIQAHVQVSGENIDPPTAAETSTSFRIDLNLNVVPEVPIIGTAGIALAMLLGFAIYKKRSKTL